MVYCNTLDYKGHRLSYFATNYGTLFLARSLLAVYKGKSYCTSPLQFYIDMSLTVRLPIGGAKPPICMGLKGFQKLFAKKPDSTLEQILISKDIVQGDLPAVEDIMVKMCFNNNGSSVVQIEDDGINSSLLSEVKQLRKDLEQQVTQNRKLQQQIIFLEKKLQMYQQWYFDTSF